MSSIMKPKSSARIRFCIAATSVVAAVLMLVPMAAEATASPAPAGVAPAVGVSTVSAQIPGSIQERIARLLAAIRARINAILAGLHLPPPPPPPPPPPRLGLCDLLRHRVPVFILHRLGCASS